MIPYWHLIKHITTREIKARYKQSFLGLFWIILNPLFQMLILSFVFSHVVRFETLGVPYSVFLFVGLLPWIFFETSISASTNALVENASLIKQVYFPREILIFSTVFAKMFDFFLASAILFIFLFVLNIDIRVMVFVIIPILLIQFLFTFGLSLLLSSLNLFYRDVQFLFTLVLKLWFYVTPIIYPIDIFPANLRWLFALNPMAYFIQTYRGILLEQQLPQFSSFVGNLIGTLILLFISYTIFKKLESSFADAV